MATKLDKTIRREIEIDGEPFTDRDFSRRISADEEAVSVRRRALSWKSLWARHGGEASVLAGDPADEQLEAARARAAGCSGPQLSF